MTNAKKLSRDEKLEKKKRTSEAAKRMHKLNNKKMKRRLAAKLQKQFALESKKKRTIPGHPDEKSQAYKLQLQRTNAWKAKKKAISKIQGTPEKRAELIEKRKWEAVGVGNLTRKQVKP